MLKPFKGKRVRKSAVLNKYHEKSYKSALPKFLLNQLKSLSPRNFLPSLLATLRNYRLASGEAEKKHAPFPKAIMISCAGVKSGPERKVVREGLPAEAELVPV